MAGDELFACVRKKKIALSPTNKAASFVRKGKTKQSRRSKKREYKKEQ